MAHQVFAAPIPFRVRIGITGRRKLAHENAVRAAVQRIVEKEIVALFDAKSKKLLAKAKNTPLRFEAVTALADDADQVVAETIKGIPGSTVAAILPLEESEYRATISAAGAARFEELLNADREPQRLRRLKLSQEFPGLSENEIQQRREAAYDLASRYLVDHCDVLVAVWDRKSGERTKQTVEYARRRGRPIFFISLDNPAEVAVEAGNGLNARAVPALDRFNSAPPDPAEERAACDRTSQEIFGSRETPEILAASAQLPDMAKEAIQKTLIPEYGRAERIAQQNQKSFQRAGFWIYLLAAVSVGLVAIAVFLKDRPPLAPFDLPHWMYVFEFSCLVVILAIYAWSRRSRAHQGWIESRFLAERFRSAFYIAACGIEASPVEVPAYLGVSHQPDDWMVRAFEESWRRLPRLPRCINPPCDPYKEFVRKSWIQEQIRHHKAKAKRCAHKEHQLERWGLLFFGGALLAALLHSWHWPGETLHHVLEPRLGRLAEYMPRVGGLVYQSFLGLVPMMDGLLTIAAIAFPAIGAALAGIRSHREYDRLAKRSKQMAAALGSLDIRIEEAEAPEELEALVREAEELMLRETQEWLMLMRFVKVEPG